MWGNLAHEKPVGLVASKSDTLVFEPWPKADESKLIFSQVNYAVQINGKLRATMHMPVDAGENDVEHKALENPEIVKWLEDKKIIKKIFVKNKIINFVI